MAYKKLQLMSRRRRAQQEEFELDEANEQILVHYRGDTPKRGDQIKKFLKDAFMKVLGKEEEEDALRLPKNHLNIRMLHINKVVTKK